MVTTCSVYALLVSRVKFAVTLRAALSVTVQLLLVPLQAPLQPVKLLPPDAWASKVTVVPASTVAEQLLPQLMTAGLLVTTPLPVPWRETDSVWFCTAVLLN